MIGRGFAVQKWLKMRDFVLKNENFASENAATEGMWVQAKVKELNFLANTICNITLAYMLPNMVLQSNFIILSFHTIYW